jgi:hypothetical protein
MPSTPQREPVAAESRDITTSGMTPIAPVDAKSAAGQDKLSWEA